MELFDPLERIDNSNNLNSTIFEYGGEIFKTTQNFTKINKGTILELIKRYDKRELKYIYNDIGGSLWKILPETKNKFLPFYQASILEQFQKNLITGEVLLWYKEYEYDEIYKNCPEELKYVTSDENLQKILGSKYNRIFQRHINKGKLLDKLDPKIKLQPLKSSATNNFGVEDIKNAALDIIKNSAEAEKAKYSINHYFDNKLSISQFKHKHDYNIFYVLGRNAVSLPQTKYYLNLIKTNTSLLENIALEINKDLTYRFFSGVAQRGYVHAYIQSLSFVEQNRFRNRIINLAKSTASEASPFKSKDWLYLTNITSIVWQLLR